MLLFANGMLSEEGALVVTLWCPAECPVQDCSSLGGATFGLEFAAGILAISEFSGKGGNDPLV
ncbi:hypothetical protein D3C78_1582200 [compost metagenome]